MTPKPFEVSIQTSPTTWKREENKDGKARTRRRKSLPIGGTFRQI
jgi:hypothetical protein